MVVVYKAETLAGPVRGPEVLATDLAQDAQALARFGARRRPPSALNHPNLHHLEIGEQAGRLFTPWSFSRLTLNIVSLPADRRRIFA